MIGKNYGKEYVPGSPRTYQNKSKNAQEAHEAVRPTDPPPHARRGRQICRPRSGASVRADLESRGREPDGIRRTRAHHRRHRRQIGARIIDLRATGQVVKFDGFLTLYQEGRDETAEDEEFEAPAGDVGERERWRSSRSTPRSISPNRRRASPKPPSSSAWKSSASAGPRPTPRSCKCCRTAAMCASTRSASSRKTKAASSSASWKASSSATSNTISPPRSKNSSTASPTTRSNWKKVLQDFWTDFIGAVNDIKEAAHHPGARRAQRSARAAYFPGARRRRRGAAVPAMRHRPAVAQSRPLRRLHRLLELSGMPLHPADDAGRRRRPAPPRCSASIRSPISK